MDKLLAGLVLAVCAVMLARLVMGESRRWKFDAALRQAWGTTRRRVVWAWRWPSVRRNAAREAEEAIRRAARVSGERDGKVFRPDAFQKKPPRDKMH
jgi:hypothetical protein